VAYPEIPDNSQERTIKKTLTVDKTETLDNALKVVYNGFGKRIRPLPKDMLSQDASLGAVTVSAARHKLD